MLDTILGLTQHLAGLDISGLPRPTGADDGSIMQTVLNVVFVVTGAIAVLMVVISGIRFITSQGNPNEVAKARNGIILAIVGILVILFAASIVNFVVFKVS